MPGAESGDGSKKPGKTPDSGAAGSTTDGGDGRGHGNTSDAGAEHATDSDAMIGEPDGAVSDGGATSETEPPTHGGNELVIWDQGFDDGPGDWTVEGGVWKFGAPTGLDAPTAYSGESVAGTDLDEEYPSSQDSRLISPEFLVPAEDELPHFRFWYWYQFADNDLGDLQVRVDGGAWQTFDTGRIHLTGESWAQRIVDLRPYARKRIQIAFRFYSNASGNARGWYVDDVSLETGEMDATANDFEGDFGDWSVEGGAWALGAPSGTDAPTAHSGDKVIGSSLGEQYGNSEDARLVSPEFLVSAADDLPHFRFWYWYQFADNDLGDLQIRVDGAAWTTLDSPRIKQTGASWVQRVVDLRPYARKRVQLGFRFYSNASGAARGWYIDDAAVETGPEEFTSPQGFESGFENWSVEAGAWVIGTPTGTDAPAPHSGNSVAGTGLGEAYNTSEDARLVSPLLLVPESGANPRLRYWYWYQFADNDLGEVQVRVDGGAWTAVADSRITKVGESWVQGMVDLRPYARKTVQVGFRFYSNASGNARGFYVDDVTLEQD